MIFPYKLPQVLDRSKTQTRRIMKPGDIGWEDFRGVFDVRNANDNTRWYRGQEVAVQPGCGKPAVLRGKYHYIPQRREGDEWLYNTHERPERLKLVRRELGWHPVRIRILRIWQEDVREISELDIKAEGFSDYADFLLRWMKMHDMKARNTYDDLWFNNDPEWEYWIECIAALPPENYQASALEFEVAE